MSDQQWCCPNCGPIDPGDATYPGLGTYRYCRKCIDVRVQESLPPFVTAMQQEIATLKTNGCTHNSQVYLEEVIARKNEEIAAKDVRIACLEKVAEAAVNTCKEVGRYGLSTEIELYAALREAGYLKGAG